MRVLLGSGGTGTPERRATLVEELRQHFGNLRRLLFVPYALADHEAYLQGFGERIRDTGYELEGIHRRDDPAAAVRNAEALAVGGGNTFRLLEALHHHRLIEPIRRRVSEGMPYFGVSAGANVACPTIRTTNDMPITHPPTLEALDLVPFQLNPHYFSGSTYIRRGEELHEHYGETRDERIAEYHELNHLPVIGLWEGGYLRVEDDRITLTGAAARLFLRGEQPRDLEPGTTFSTSQLAPGERPVEG